MLLDMKNKKSGQIALIVLLIMVTLLTIGLSLISYSVTDVKISQDEKEAMRAFSAAEAGIEEALRQEDLGSWTPQPLDVGKVPVNITVNPNSGTIVKRLAECEFMNIDLEGAEDGTVLTVKWDPAAALEIVFYEDNGTTIREGDISGRQVVKSSGTTCDNGTFPIDGDNNLSLVIDTDGVSRDDELIRIRALCNATTVTIIVNSGNLPVHAYTIESRAAVGSAEESKTSAVEVSKTIPALPPIFDYVLFSEGNIE